MDKILVTGASGFIGLELVRQLTDKGYCPRILIRRPARAPMLGELNVEFLQGDLESPESLSRACQGIDTIFHLGARAIFEEYDLVKPTIVDGSLNLMKAAIAAKIKRFIYASSLLVYDSQEKPIDQTTPLKPSCGYGRAKMEAEQQLSEMARGHMLFGSLRLPHVYGSRDLMFEEIRKGRLFVPGHGRNLFANMHVYDAAASLMAAAEKNWEGMSAVSDDLPIDWNEFFAVIRKYYPRLNIHKIPKAIALLGTYLLTPIRRMKKHPSIYAPDSVISWNLNLPVKKGLLWDELQTKPKYPTIYQGIPAVLDDCVPFRWIHPIHDRVG